MAMSASWGLLLAAVALALCACTLLVYVRDALSGFAFGRVVMLFLLAEVLLFRGTQQAGLSRASGLAAVGVLIASFVFSWIRAQQIRVARLARRAEGFGAATVQRYDAAGSLGLIWFALGFAGGLAIESWTGRPLLAVWWLVGAAGGMVHSLVSLHHVRDSVWQRWWVLSPLALAIGALLAMLFGIQVGEHALRTLRFALMHGLVPALALSLIGTRLARHFFRQI